MDEKFLYDIIEAAAAGTVHAEELAAGMQGECFHAANGVLEINPNQQEETLQAIREALNNINCMLSLLSEIHATEAATRSRRATIEAAAEHLATMQRPEIDNGFMDIPEGIEEDLPIRETDETPPEERNRAAYIKARRARAIQTNFNP